MFFKDWIWKIVENEVKFKKKVVPLNVLYQIIEDVEKEKDRPSWDKYFLNIARAVSLRSHDSQTKHGAVICTKNHKPLGFGFNGFPRKIDEKDLPTTRPDKMPWMIHAEINALAHCTLSPEGATAYITGQPCNNCLITLWQNGINEIVYPRGYSSTLIDDKANEFQKEFLKRSELKIREL